MIWLGVIEIHFANTLFHPTGHNVLDHVALVLRENR